MKKLRSLKQPSKSIKTRLVGNFMVVILISVIAFEALLIYFTIYYYYNNVEAILTNQIKISSDFYSRYFSNVSLEDNIMDNVDIFWKQTYAEVQIIDSSGNLLMDSIGLMPSKKIQTSDFMSAIKGNKGRWIGKANDGGKVMAISYPLKSGEKVVGVLRFITSLEEVDKTINSICTILISMGFAVVFVGGLVSIFLARSIIHPIKELTKAAEEMADGNFKTRVSKHRDDEIGILGDTLNYMVEEIEKRDQIKNEFISSITHELRTPLTSIKGWAITLGIDELEDKTILRDGLKIIEDESERLTSMVEELLDFSRFVSGKVKLNINVENLNDIVKYIETYMEPRAQREGLQFFTSYEADLPPIKLDRDRIKQVLINLLDNAFKFTSKGGRVELTTSKEDKWIVLTVKDNGSGISDDDLPRVKEKFYKGKNSKSHSGIGLSICDEIIKMHGGELIIKSQLHSGTTVLVKLPVEVN